VIHNTGAEDDRLIAAASDAAQRVELHTHSEDAQGVMRMREVVEGFAVPAGGTHALERGADHVMFMGMTRTLAEGDVVAVTLTFEKAGAIAVDLPVDNSRMPGAMQGQGHGQTHGMKHGG
jgi:copper(I)-binding protein